MLIPALILELSLTLSCHGYKSSKNRWLSPFVGVQLLCATLDQTWLFLCAAKIATFSWQGKQELSENVTADSSEGGLGSLCSILNPSALHNKGASSLSHKKNNEFLRDGWKVFDSSCLISTRRLLVIALSNLTHLIKNYWRTSCPLHALPQFL